MIVKQKMPRGAFLILLASFLLWPFCALYNPVAMTATRRLKAGINYLTVRIKNSSSDTLSFNAGTPGEFDFVVQWMVGSKTTIVPYSNGAWYSFKPSYVVVVKPGEAIERTVVIPEAPGLAAVAVDYGLEGLGERMYKRCSVAGMTNRAALIRMTEPFWVKSRRLVVGVGLE